jgi:hypothetical protein
MVAHAQQTWQMLCYSGGESTVMTRDSNQYGHEILVNFQKPSGNVGCRGLQPGHSTWPNRALRGAELSSRLYFQLDGRAVVINQFQLERRNGFPVTSGQRSPNWNGPGATRENVRIYQELHWFSTAMEGSRGTIPVRDYPYGVCVKADTVYNVYNFRAPNQGSG